MKKEIRQIRLSRETLQALETPSLGKAAGGAYTFPPVCENSANAPLTPPATNAITRFTRKARTSSA